MKILGYEIFKSQEVAQINEKLTKLEDSVRLRPVEDFVQSTQSDGSIVPAWSRQMKFEEIEDLSKLSSVYRQVVSTLQWEIFRNGGDFEPNFVKKCVGCGKEFDHKTEVCDECGKQVREPDYSQLKLVKPFFKKVNSNKQNIIDVCKSVEPDVDTFDDLYLLCLQNYFFDSNKEIVSSELKEIVRVAPKVIRFIADSSKRLGYLENGKRALVCPLHRNQLATGERCTVCGTKTYPSHFKAVGNGNQKDVYYLPNEIIHRSKFSPSLTNGFPPFLSLYQKVMIELNMDWYVRKGYEKGRNPNGWLFIKTKNLPSLNKMIEIAYEKLKLNPHSVFPIGVETDVSGNFANYVNMMNSMQEQQAVEFRDTIKREIGAMFGVQPLFQGDTSSGGGLNNEGLQITVTNRAVEIGQAVYNEGVFPAILDLFGVTDFCYKLKPSEEQDKMAELQQKNLEIQNATLMSQLGYEHKLSEAGEFEFSSTPTQPVPNPRLPNLQVTDEMTYGNQRFSGEPSSVRKASPVSEQKKNVVDVEEVLNKALADLVEDLKFKRIVSKEQLEKRVEELVLKFGEKTKKMVEKEIKATYYKTMEQVEKELNRNILFTDKDKNAINLLASSKPLTEAYVGMTQKVSEKINKVIEEAYTEPGSLDINSLVKTMQEVTEEEESSLRRIARTETSKVSHLARMNSYEQIDENGKGLYRWIGPSDDRTTPTCKELKARTNKGVPLIELQNLIKEVSAKYDPDFVADGMTPHFQCRHTFVRIN